MSTAVLEPQRVLVRHNGAAASSRWLSGGSCVSGTGAIVAECSTSFYQWGCGWRRLCSEMRMCSCAGVNLSYEFRVTHELAVAVPV